MTVEGAWVDAEELVERAGGTCEASRPAALHAPESESDQIQTCPPAGIRPAEPAMPGEAPGHLGPFSPGSAFRSGFRAQLRIPASQWKRRQRWRLCPPQPVRWPADSHCPRRRSDYRHGAPAGIGGRCDDGNAPGRSAARSSVWSAR